MEVGIVSFGAYVPTYRIKTHDIASVWGANGDVMSRGLRVQSKSIPAPDEDVVTI
jgi:hydroxymethylglutaryl-CoA synthase